MEKMEDDFTPEQWKVIDKQKDEGMMYAKAAKLSLHCMLPSRFFVVANNYQLHAYVQGSRIFSGSETFFMTTAIFEEENWEALRKSGKTFAQNSLEMILKNEGSDITLIPVGKHNKDYLIGKFKNIIQKGGYILGTTSDKPGRNIYVPMLQDTLIQQYEMIGPLRNRLSLMERIKKIFR